MFKVPKKSNGGIWFKVGVGLLIFACMLWASIIFVPFLSLPGVKKASIIGTLLIAGEVAFWVGAILTGKKFVERYKKHFNPKNWKSIKNKTHR